MSVSAETSFAQGKEHMLVKSELELFLFELSKSVHCTYLQMFLEGHHPTLRGVFNYLLRNLEPNVEKNVSLIKGVYISSGIGFHSRHPSH